MRSPHVHVTVNLDQVRAAAEAIRAQTRVGLIAVIKADAYGLGAPRIADVLGPVVDDFAYFSVHEAREVGRPGLVLGPPEGDPAEFRELNLRPAVADLAAARKFAGLRVAIKVDTGMQRFGCPPAELDQLVPHCDVADYFSHAVTLDATRRLQAACAGRGRPMHAAATCLLDQPEAWFDAVRPGLALYRGAVRVITHLQAVHDTSGPVGYTGFHPTVTALEKNYLRVGDTGRGEAVLPISAPGDITRVRMGVHWRARDPRDGYEVSASFDGGKTWKSMGKLGLAQPANCTYLVLSDVPAGARDVQVRLAGVQKNTACIFDLRIDVDYKEPCGGFRPVKVTYVWEEDGKPKTDEHVCRKAEESWTIKCGPKTVAKSYSVELAK